MIYKKRHLLSAEEITLSYNMIAQVILKKFPIVFAHLDLVTTGSDTEIKIKWAIKSKAIKAKQIIDKKVHQTYRSLMEPDMPTRPNVHAALYSQNDNIDSLERSLVRLDELLKQGKISKGEFNKKKHVLLKRH